MDLDTVRTSQNEPEKHEPYLSKEGFTQARILRGFTEIEELAKTIMHKGIICGGYVRYMCSPNHNPIPASDVDVYPFSGDNFDDLKKKFKDEGLTKKHENNMSITYSRPDDPNHSFFATPTIQLIKPVIEGKVISVGTMEEILSNFDFTVVRAGIEFKTVDHDGLTIFLPPNTAMVDADFIHDETNKILRLKNIHCPISSTLRCMKYSRKGYWLPPTHVLTLFEDWDSRSGEYKSKLYDYLAKANEGKGLTKEQVDELEELMRID